MSRRQGRRRSHGGAEHEDSNERWLLTYADMITLLMALFMVLFSISSVNISKYQVLQKALRAAFSGAPLPGGKSIAKPGATANSSHAPTSTDVQAIVPSTPQSQTGGPNSSAQSTTAHAPTLTSAQAAALQHQEETFQQIKRELDAYAAHHGIASKVQTVIESRGLVIRVLTDDLLFASGQATLSGRSHALLGEIAKLLNIDTAHPLDVEGNTDSVPIHSALYPSNWELSTARASTVVRFMISQGVGAARLTASGYADQHPLASDATAGGRARNRRVEIVMKRISATESEL